MRFFRNGPDIPEYLLQAHEDGRVVVFCGAGISMPVFPDYARLVKNLYVQFEPTPNPIQKKAIRAGQYDIALGLLEREFGNDHAMVRQELASALEIPPEPIKNTPHENLLTLSKNHGDGYTHLITTNFDRLFEKTITDKVLQVNRFQAPCLPILKNQWDGLVYLHGFLSENPTPSVSRHGSAGMRKAVLCSPCMQSTYKPPLLEHQD